MNNTPRRGPGGFPATPQTHRSPGFRSSNPNASTPSRPNVRTTLPPVPQTAAQTSSGPRIPTDILDAASQRFYAFAVYVGLWAWRTYDFYTLVASDQDSILTCFKWMGIDMVFMFCLPLLEIPWLEWSNGTAFVLFGLHAALDFMLMNRIGVPLQTWAISLVAFMWDSENAIGERSVKPGPILHNASLILGKQIINILPEGSAILNPYKQPFCFNSSVTHLELPILINQTEPVEIELWRIDLESNQNETITVRKSELRGLVKKARKALKTVDPADALLLRYPVKKTGVYMLKKVLDHSKLEVRPHALTAVVATCPQARVKPTGKFRCRNDVSDVTIEVIGVPPLRIRYSTTLNNAPQAGTEFESLQPDDFVSPLSRHTSQALVHGSREDVSWAQSRKVDVALNETLTSSGVRQYAIEEVYDALGNSVNYLNFEEDGQPRQKTAAIQTFTVLERPKVMLDGCSPQTPLKVAKGHVARLPVRFSSTGKGALDAPHTIEYLFTPEADLGLDGGHSENAQLKKQTLKLSREQPQISANGLYTINSVSTDRCEGEVLEPASCLLQNPPEPGLVLGKEDIVDKCAGNPIGLRVSMDLVGTPPFYVRYKEERNGGRSRVVEKEITSLRGTMDLTPGDAGHYTYTFESIRDNVYPDRPLYNLQLAQDVKPSASAHFMEHSTVKQVCIDDSVEFDVRLQGEGPWKLEYEIVHNGKRVKHSAAISEEHYTIKTQQLRSGGEYIVTLASITDKMGCKEFLKEEAKVNVRHERPKAYFGLIDGKQTVMALEGKLVDLPLRLTGAAPWRLEYENLDTKDVQRIDFRDPNARLGIKSEGTYQLLSVRDSVCPGFIDEKANQFHVGWIQRPRIGISESSGAVFEDNRYIKEAVCEGDEDSFDISLSGHPPFDVKYEQHSKDKKNGKTASLRKKDLRALSGVASIRAETSKAGTYEYKFIELADSKYDHSSHHFTPVTVQQTVHDLPNAHFNNPGKTYSYCSRDTESGEEVIPITLEGVPPFYLEVEIKHYGTPKPELSIHKNIAAHKYDLKIEHRKLHLGHSAISIRKVRDARGCTRKPLPNTPRVQVSVHDAPTATPLEDKPDFCVGDRLSFALSGQVPFTVYYTFEKQERKANNAGTTFRRLAELPGSFTITGLRDSASECLAQLNLTKTIHPIPTVRLAKGQISEVDIHEGGGTDLEFTFTGTPPFEFTYTRSTNAAKGRKSKVLEIRTEVSHQERLSVPVMDEGTYEVVSIKDRWCSYAKAVEGAELARKGGQKMLQY